MNERDGDGNAGWRESTEGDLDPDLTDEAGSDLTDWEAPFEGTRRPTLARVAIGVLLVALLLSVIVRVV